MDERVGQRIAPTPLAPAAPGAGSRPAAFLDRDGVINLDRGYVGDIARFTFVPGVCAATAQLAAWGFVPVVVTNQAGIGRGMYTEEDFARLSAWMCARFAAAGVTIAGVYHCPHHPRLALGALRRVCDCRKPAPGMLLLAAQQLGLALEASVMFGDTCDDMRAALAAGVGTRILLGKDGRALPTDACADVPLSLRHASLASAVADPAVRQLLRVGATPANP